MIEAWWPTRNSTIAACLGALGMPIRIDVVLDERSGQELTTFYLGLRSMWKNLATEHLISQWRKGKLQTADPAHPFLCGLHAAHNAVMLQRLLRNGLPLRLAVMDGGVTTIYEEGPESPSLIDAPELIETNDQALVAAFAVIGIPVVGVEGTTFRLPRWGHVLKHPFTNQWSRYDGQSLLAELRSGRLEKQEPQHPLVTAYNARLVQTQLDRHLLKTQRRILLRKPLSIRAAFVTEQAKPAMLDRVARHFRIA